MRSARVRLLKKIAKKSVSCQQMRINPNLKRDMHCVCTHIFLSCLKIFMKIKTKVNFFRDCGVSDENPNLKGLVLSSSRWLQSSTSSSYDCYYGIGISTPSVKGCL